MLRLRCALWLWLTTVAPALSFTLAPFTQRPRPSTTRIFSDEVDDVECAPNDDECVANLSDDDYSDDAGALEVIDDDAPDLGGARLEDSPYYEWFEAYGSDEMEALARRLESLLPETVEDVVAERYVEAMRLERDFFAAHA